MRPEIPSNSGVLTFLHIYSLHWQEKIGARSIGNNLITLQSISPIGRTKREDPHTLLSQEAKENGQDWN